MIITGTHDSILVILSILLAIAASFTALDLAGRVRVSAGLARGTWLATAALAMGGGIWAMHFVAMLAFSMPGMEVGYDVGLTILSLAIAIGATGVGFYVVGRSAQPKAGPLVLAGLLMGVGIAAMHYIGMAAMRMRADLSYDRFWAALSILIAIGAASAALWLSNRTNRPAERIAAAMVMGVAVAGMHYAAMQGSIFRMQPGIDMARGGASLGQAKLAIGVAASTFLILFLALVAALFDRRYADTQKRLQDDLKTAYDDQSLMLNLVERMRTIDEPFLIMSEIAEGLGRHLKVDRAGFFRVVEDAAIDFEAGASFIGGELPHLSGTLPINLFDEALNRMVRAGETIAFADARMDPRHAAYLEIGTLACVCAPISRQGKWEAAFYCNHATSRRWSAKEIKLVEDVAALTWDAVERAEARLELRFANRRLEARVEEQTRQTRLIADALPALIAFVDRDLVYQFANEAYKDWLYLPRDKIIGRSLIDLFDDNDLKVRRPFLDRALAGEEVRFELEWPRRDGKRRIAEIRYLPRRYKDAVTGLYIFVHDITERVDAAELLKSVNTRLEVQVAERTRELMAAEALLRQSQKMEAVGQLTGGIAHDFNNLLTGISGNLEFLQSRINQGRYAELDRYVIAAQGAAKRAASLTHRLLAFSRRQTLDPKPTDVNRLVADLLDLVRRSVGPDIQVEAVGLAGAWAALVDPNQLENAVLNLCINARDAMPDGGRITIETANRWLDERAARERELPPGQYLSLCVTDNGAGMIPSIVAQAFEPFFTTKPIGEGTGLGLSMIYGFVRQSGGQARIYSEVGQGTTVCIYLPRHYGEAVETETPQHQDGEPIAVDGETVLVVDDEPTIRTIVTEVLDELGYIALEAADGAAGLRLLESEARVDLLVTDVGLPGGMNGRQMADRAREVRADLNVLFITGFAENAVIAHSNLKPGMEILTKPFTVEALASRIKGLMVDKRLPQ